MSNTAIIILLIVAVSNSVADRLERCSSNFYRLPKNVIPTHYDLTVDVDLAKNTFNGQVGIHVNVENINEQLGQNQIALHASYKLSIEKVEYVTSGSSIEVLDICRNKNDVVIITLAHDLVVGSEGVLHILFVGRYGREQSGFYKSSHTTSTRESYDIAVTDFEPISARSAFPCFDEPAFKATFSITIIHSKQQTALSNAPLLSQELIEGSQEERFKSIFAKTPRMSTYLVAYSVGRFDYIEQVILDGRVTLRFYAPEGRAEESRYVLNTAAKALPLLEDYFGIEFPLNKIDFVSVKDYSEGAMENWGLITMLEDMVLDNPSNMYFSMINAAQITVHELAHQWFGNLVTMEWWNDLWLNEGFANWVQYNMTELILPNTDFDAIFVRDAMNTVFKTDFDGKESAVAFRHHNEDISADSLSLIVYDKGSAIIRNLQQEYLHPDNFRSALRHYMKTHAYRNAKAQDLWHSMELYSKEPVAQFMESWLYQDGHPILSVQVKNGFLAIKQSVFTRDQTRVHDSEKRWIIPVSILVSDSETREEVIAITLTGEEEEEMVMLSSWYNPKDSHHWLKLNCNATGLYNVEYSTDLLLSLRRPIEKKLMKPLDRLDLLTNYASIFEASVYEPSIKLKKFVKWFANEDDYGVIGGMLETFKGYFFSPKGKPNQNRSNHELVDVLLQIFAHYLKEKGYHKGAKTNAYTQEVQSTILIRALDHQYKPIIKSLMTMLDDSKSYDTIPQPYKEILLRCVLSHGSSHQIEQLQTMVDKMHDCPLKEKFLGKLKTSKPSKQHKLSKLFKH